MTSSLTLLPHSGDTLKLDSSKDSEVKVRPKLMLRLNTHLKPESLLPKVLRLLPEELLNMPKMLSLKPELLSKLAEMMLTNSELKPKLL